MRTRVKIDLWRNRGYIYGGGGVQLKQYYVTDSVRQKYSALGVREFLELPNLIYNLALRLALY